MEFVVGVDAGGTKTVAWLAEARGTSIVGRGAAGPGNPQAVGWDAAIRQIEAAVETAFQAAGSGRQTVASACLAVAGVDRADQRRQLDQWNQCYGLARRVAFVHDAAPVLAAGTPEGWGVALVAGTGSFAFGRNAAGVETRVGGWGYLLGDEGSGYAIALAGLRAAARSADGRAPSTLLLDRFLEHFQIAMPSQLIPVMYGTSADRASIASLAGLVGTAADDGDATAVALIREAGNDLAEMVEALARRLDLPQPAFPLALAGGAVLHCSHLRRELLAALAVRQLRPQPLAEVADPVAGAVQMARGLIAQ